MILMKKPDGSLRAIGLDEGWFVRINQGFDKEDTISHVSKAQPGHMAFAEFDSEPECTWGTSVYRVRRDGTLHLISENNDSSD